MLPFRLNFSTFEHDEWGESTWFSIFYIVSIQYADLRIFLKQETLLHDDHDQTIWQWTENADGHNKESIKKMMMRIIPIVLGGFLF